MGVLSLIRIIKASDKGLGSPEGDWWGFDVHTDTRGEAEFCTHSMNVVSLVNSNFEDLFYRTYDRTLNPSNKKALEYQLCQWHDDSYGFVNAYKLLNYIKEFGFDVEIVEESD